MLRDKLNEALKEAMRARDMATVGAVRLIIAKLKDRKSTRLNSSHT